MDLPVIACAVFRCMNNIRLFFFSNVVKNMLKKLLRTKRVYFFGIIYIETINRSVFGGIYVNNRFFHKDEAYFVYFLGKKLNSDLL